MASVNMSTTFSPRPSSELSTQEPDQQSRESHNTSTSTSPSISTSSSTSTTTSIILPTILSLILSSTIVLLTSPTLPPLTLSTPQRPTLLSLHAHLTDLTLTLLISFLLLCNHGPTARWIARNQSFPYSYSPSWNIGRASLNFQLVIFEIFHVGKTARTIHSAGIILEQALWTLLVHQTFGSWGLILLFILLSWQAWTYQCPRLAVGITIANTVFALLSIVLSSSPYLLQNITREESTAWTKLVLFYTVTIRTLSHVLEPLPPVYRPSVAVFDDGFGGPGWRLCLTSPARAVWLVVLGNVSEFGAGMPGRLFGVVVYKALWRVGVVHGDNGGGLLDVDEAKVQAWRVVDHGWMANEVTRDMYAWALSGGGVLGREGLFAGRDGEKDLLDGDVDRV